MSPARGTHRERREQTVAALVEEGRSHFARDGFLATSLDAVCAAAGVSKGALYHHFPNGKRQLFEAVFAAEQDALAMSEHAAYAAEREPWAGVRAGCLAFLRAASDPGVQRIVLLDAPGALGEEAHRAFQQKSVRLLAEALRAAMDAGSLEPRPEAPLAEMLHAALGRAALVAARPDAQAIGHDEMAEEFNRLLDGLARRPPG